MRIASQFVAFLIVVASLAGPCLAASKVGTAQKQPIETLVEKPVKNMTAVPVAPLNSDIIGKTDTTGDYSKTEDLSKFFAVSGPCKEDCQKKQCTKAVINRAITQVRFVLLPIGDGPSAAVSYKPRLRDQKLSKLFAQNAQPCNRSVDLYALCRQLN